MKKIILASASPRRKELLEKIGVKFDVEPSHHQETLDITSEPHRLAQRLSFEKAQAIARNHRDALIIAADTIAVLDSQILGKPRTETEARRMLEALNGKWHSVITGFTIMDTGSGKTVSRTVETRVYLRKLTPDEINAYIASKEPLDKAGGYAIQGLGAVIVDRIEGDYYNVIGLPLSALAECLKEFGVNILQPHQTA